MYDLLIIGAGWAGFNAALTAKSYGLKVCLIEQAQLGGTCLNLGCIPTKALLQSSKVYTLLKKSSVFGVFSSSPARIELSPLQERKEKIVQQLRRGIEYSLKGVEVVYGTAEITGGQSVKVGAKDITARHILLATGSIPLALAEHPFDGENILSSNHIVGLKEIPSSLLIIGGGVIGCECATLFANMGAKVTIVELMPQLLPGEDKDIAKKLEVVFKKKGIQVITGQEATSAQCANFAKVLVCVGRSPKTDIPGLESVGVKCHKGAFVVDDYLKTSVETIYAAGDCTAKTMLAHFAAYQGRIAAENIAHPDHAQKADNRIIPNCIFTEPEIASVGLHESQAKESNIPITIHEFDFLGSGMARILDETGGFIKIISHQNTGEILGASLIGPKATELISLLTLALQFHHKVSDLKELIFAHPTLSESIGEALRL